MALFDDRGRQIPDQRPVEVPLELRRPLSIQEEIKRFVRQELSRRAEASALETFEESDDFELDDEDDVPATQYELILVPEPGDVDPSIPFAKPAKPNEAVSPDKGGGVSTPDKTPLGE